MKFEQAKASLTVGQIASQITSAAFLYLVWLFYFEEVQQDGLEN
jgi:hypothetical protein